MAQLSSSAAQHQSGSSQLLALLTSAAHARPPPPFACTCALSSVGPSRQPLNRKRIRGRRRRLFPLRAQQDSGAAKRVDAAQSGPASRTLRSLAYAARDAAASRTNCMALSFHPWVPLVSQGRKEKMKMPLPFSPPSPFRRPLRTAPASSSPPAPSVSQPGDAARTPRPTARPRMPLHARRPEPRLALRTRHDTTGPAPHHALTAPASRPHHTATRSSSRTFLSRAPIPCRGWTPRVRLPHPDDRSRP